MFASQPVTIQVSTAPTAAGNGAHDTEGGSSTGESTGEAATDVASPVITEFPDPPFPTATHRPSPNATDFQSWSEAAAWDVHAIPSVLVITRFPDPLSATATHRLFPYATERHELFAAAEVRDVQAIPSVLVITRFPDPLEATATHRLFPYATEFQLLSAADVRIVQVIPSARAGDTAARRLATTINAITVAQNAPRLGCREPNTTGMADQKRLRRDFDM